MAKNPDPKLGPPLPSVDETRRRLTKAGLAVPAVLGALASRPVLGQSLHNCTPSGHISGFASPAPEGVDCAVGKDPAYYAASKTRWPSGFVDAQDKALPLNQTPPAQGAVFANAYEVRQVSNDNFVRDATVWDVVKGSPVNPVNGNAQNNNYLTTKANYIDDDKFTLGKEAVAACMNALLIANFPISARGVVDMFNNVITGGVDLVADGLTWNATEVIEYFQSLHS